nr:hypothetical protein CFP56_29850 [Quercus suber]
MDYEALHTILPRMELAHLSDDLAHALAARGSGCDGSACGGGASALAHVVLASTVSVHFRIARHAPTLVHPSQPVGILLQREDLARVFLDAAMAFPDAVCFARVLQLRSKVWRASSTKGLLQDLELFAIAGWDGDGDLDGPVDITHWTTDAPGEPCATLDGREFFERQGDPVPRQQMFQRQGTEPQYL